MTEQQAENKTKVFNYNNTFQINPGILSRDEQEKLGQTMVAIVGTGGAGGVMAIVLARKTTFKGTIAHGMMILAYVSQMMTATFGQKWFDSSQFDVRFKTPARPGDILTVGGIIRDINTNKEGTLVLCDVSCRNQKGEPVIIGEISIQL